MNYHGIRATEARAFIRQHICNPRIRAGLKWFMVYDLQYFPVGRCNVYLIAGGSGLTGVVGVARKAA